MCKKTQTELHGFDLKSDDEFKQNYQHHIRQQALRKVGDEEYCKLTQEGKQAMKSQIDSGLSDEVSTQARKVPGQPRYHTPGHRTLCRSGGLWDAQMH